MAVVIYRLAILILVLMPFYVWAATERYIIYPKEGLSLLERQEFTKELETIAGPHGNIYTSIRRPNSSRQEIRFWCVDLTEEDSSKLSQHRDVLDIRVDDVALNLLTEYEASNRSSTHLFRPTREMITPNSSGSEDSLDYSTQVSPVAIELRALSQPAGSDSINRYPNYVYPIGGRRTYIYHVELGINQEHTEFDSREREWLFTETAKYRGADTTTEAAAGQGHSTCTASKAVGNLYGASKSATLVVVKMPALDYGSAYEVLDTVIDDIDDKSREGRSVVSVSWNTKETVTPEFLRSPLAVIIRQRVAALVARGVRVVCAAGNDALTRSPTGELRTHVDTYPALSLVIRGRSARPLLVVGNSYINGVRYADSQQTKDYPLLHAPGVNIKCASNTSLTGYRTWTGTSFSAPLVAGVIADLLSTGQIATSHPFWWKRPGGENVVWNYVTNAQNPPIPGNGNATLVNYTSPGFATTPFSNEQLDVSTE